MATKQGIYSELVPYKNSDHPLKTPFSYGQKVIQINLELHGVGVEVGQKEPLQDVPQ